MTRDELLKRLTSRKFILALVAAIVAFGNSMWDWGLTVEEIMAFAAPILLYIGIEGVRDIRAVK